VILQNNGWEKCSDTTDFTLKKAGPEDVAGTAKECSKGWRAIYGYLEDIHKM
jgi:hypothetical protein